MLHLTWRGVVDGAVTSSASTSPGTGSCGCGPYFELRDRATNYRVFDERLLSLYGRLAKAEYDDQQLQAFCRLMTSICRRTCR